MFGTMMPYERVESIPSRDTRLDRTVAITVLPEHVANDPDLKQRFEREARTVAGLSHPHICPVFDVGSQNGIDYLVVEYLNEETPTQRLEKGGVAARSGAPCSAEASRGGPDPSTGEVSSSVRPLSMVRSSGRSPLRLGTVGSTMAALLMLACSNPASPSQCRGAIQLD